MALVRTNRNGTQSGTAVGTGSYTTPSFTPTDGSLLFVIASSVSGTAISSANLTIADSLGTLTWTSRLTWDATFSVDDAAVRVWTTPIVTGASMTVTIDAGADSTDTYTVVAVDYTGADTASPLGATASNTDFGASPSGAKSITLSAAPDTASEVIGFLVRDDLSGTVSSTPGATYTEQYDLDIVGHGGAEVETRTASTSTTVDWVSINDAGTLSKAGALAFEVKASTASVEANFPFTPDRFDDVRPTEIRPSEVTSSFVWFDVSATGVINALNLTATQVQTPTFQLQVGKNLSVTQTQTPSIIRQVGKILTTVTQAQTASIIRSITKILSATETQTPSMTEPVTHPATLTATQVQTPTMVRQVGKILSATQVQTPTIVRSVGKILSATEVQTPTIVRSVGKNLSATQAQTPTLTASRAFLRTLSATQTQTVTMVRSVGKTLSVTQAQLPAMVRQVTKTLSAVQTQIVSIVRQIGKTLTVTETQTPSQTAIKATLRTLTATQVQTPTLVATFQPGSPVVAAHGVPEIQHTLNRLAGTLALSLDAQAAANVWASTTNLDTVGALNVKASASKLEFNAVSKLLASQLSGDASADAQYALASIPLPTGPFMSPAHPPLRTRALQATKRFVSTRKGKVTVAAGAAVSSGTALSIFELVT